MSDRPDQGDSGPAAEPSVSGRSAVRAAGDRTIEHYQNWMQTNGAAHLLRAARESGITSRLRDKQHTIQELCGSLSLEPATAELVIDGLVAIGFVERYGDDYALARAGHLLCQYDDDLGDHLWDSLVDRLRASTPETAVDAVNYRSQLAATQWIHTAAAIQAAEILDIGGEASPRGPRILDLGCGSAVWSCAMAHRDADASIVAVDQAASIQAARSTADSIGLADRFSAIESDPTVATLGQQHFDVVILAQMLSAYSDSQASGLLQKATDALRPGGRLVAPDFYLGPGRAGLKESLARLSIHLATAQGRVRDLGECQAMFVAAGLGSIQFAYLAASEAGLGMIVAQRLHSESEGRGTPS